MQRAYYAFRAHGSPAREALRAERVEALARNLGLEVTWEPEWDRYEDVFGDLDDHETQERIDSGEYECLYGYVRNPADSDEILASCGMFVAPPSSFDWRGFEYELLGEATASLRKRYAGTI